MKLLLILVKGGYKIFILFIKRWIFQKNEILHASNQKYLNVFRLITIAIDDVQLSLHAQDHLLFKRYLSGRKPISKLESMKLRSIRDLSNFFYRIQQCK